MCKFYNSAIARLGSVGEVAGVAAIGSVGEVAGVAGVALLL